MTVNIVALINAKLQLKWRPEQISEWLRATHTLFSRHETISLHILAEKRRKGRLFKHLRRKGKAYQPKNKDKQAGRGFIKNRVHIDERPSI